MLKTSPVIAALLAILSTCGCSELHTNTPFGEATQLNARDRLAIEGLWEYPAPSPEYKTTYRVRCDAAQSKGTIEVRTESGMRFDYDAVFRKVEGGHDSGGTAVFFRRNDGSEKDWRFAWVGQALGTFGEMSGVPNCLVLVFPDAQSTKDFGLTTKESRYAVKGSGIPPLGVLTEKPAGLSQKQWDEFPDAGQAVMTLDESPEAIMAKLREKDLRTLMLPLTPFVLLRVKESPAAK